MAGDLRRAPDRLPNVAGAKMPIARRRVGSARSAQRARSDEKAASVQSSGFARGENGSQKTTSARAVADRSASTASPGTSLQENAVHASDSSAKYSFSSTSACADEARGWTESPDREVRAFLFAPTCRGLKARAPVQQRGPARPRRVAGWFQAYAAVVSLAHVMRARSHVTCHSGVGDVFVGYLRGSPWQHQPPSPQHSRDFT